MTCPAIWTDRERARLERLCAVVSGDPSAAPDLAQETLLQAWRIRDRLTEPEGASAWLDAVARNVCRRWRADRARRLTHETPRPDPAADNDRVEEVLEHDELVELLDRALALLPPATREALVATYVEDRGTDEIGQALGVSPDAVAMRLVRGRAALRDLLETTFADEPLARTWRARHGTAWRPTRIHCPECGTTPLEWRRDVAIELRCSTCTPGDVSSSFRLDNPAYASLRDAQRPSTVLARVDGWIGDWWPDAIAGGAPCTRCGRTVQAAPYRRDEPLDDRTRRGWQATCDGCSESVSISFGGLTLALAGARVGGRRPRALPTRATTVGGRAAVVVQYADRAGQVVEGVFDDATSRLVPAR